MQQNPCTYANNFNSNSELIVVCLCYLIISTFVQNVLTHVCRCIVGASDAAALRLMHRKQYFVIH